MNVGLPRATALAAVLVMFALGACASDGSSADKAPERAGAEAHDHDAHAGEHVAYRCAACGKTAEVAIGVPAPS